MGKTNNQNANDCREKKEGKQMLESLAYYNENSMTVWLLFEVRWWAN
jgi:hypothetical protein